MHQLDVLVYVVEMRGGVSHFRELNPFPVFQEVLLRADDTTWPHDAKETDDFASSETIMLHQETANEGSRATKASLAMNCDGTASNCLFCDGDELLDVSKRRLSPIDVIHLVVLDSFASEDRLVVFVEIEANDCDNVVLLEIWQVMR